MDVNLDMSKSEARALKMATTVTLENARNELARVNEKLDKDTITNELLLGYNYGKRDQLDTLIRILEGWVK